MSQIYRNLFFWGLWQHTWLWLGIKVDPNAPRIFVTSFPRRHLVRRPSVFAIFFCNHSMRGSSEDQICISIKNYNFHFLLKFPPLMEISNCWTITSAREFCFACVELLGWFQFRWLWIWAWMLSKCWLIIEAICGDNPWVNKLRKLQHGIVFWHVRSSTYARNCRPLQIFFDYSDFGIGTVL
jgi:hypothetical protein